MAEDKNLCLCAWLVRNTLLTLEGLDHLAEIQPNLTVKFGPGPMDPADLSASDLLLPGLLAIENECALQLGPEAPHLVADKAYGKLQKLILASLEKCIPE